MLPSIPAQAARKAIPLLTRCSTGRGYFLRPQKFGPVHFIIISMLALPLAALLNVQAALAQQSHAAQRPAPSQQLMLQKKYNDAALIILGGYPGTTYFNMAHEMAATLDGSGGLRLIAMDAPGGMESLRDLLLLRGVDLALLPGNLLDYADKIAAFGPGLTERLTYVTALYGEEVHVLVGPGVSSIEDLGGKKLAVPPDDGNAEFTVHDLLRRFHLDAEVTKIVPADAVDDVRSGALAALVLVGGKPLRAIAALPKDGSIRLLPLPSMQALGDGYSPGSFGPEDYPALIPAGRTIDTWSVGTVLAAKKMVPTEESNRRIARFVPAFFGSFSELSARRWHPKWREVNLAATLVKWQRFPVAKEWLDNALREQSASVQRDFEEFLRTNSPAGSPLPPPAVQKRLFEKYLKWTRSVTSTPD